MSDWISVKERLPEQSERERTNYVIAYFEWKRPKGIIPMAIQFAEISNGKWRPMGGSGDFTQYVTHWMPIPEPPK